MNFDFSDDQKLLQQIAKDFLDEHSPLSVCREVLESDAPYSQSLWKGAAELGWLGTAVPEEYGGSGFGYLELAVVAEEVGRALAPIPFSSSVYLATEALLLAGSDEQKKRLLPSLARGESIGTAAFTEKPGQNGVEGVEARVEGGKLSGSKLPVPDGEAADVAVVAAQGGKGLSLYLVSLTGDGVERETVHSLDPSRPAARITFEGAPAELLGASNIDQLFEQLTGELGFDHVILDSPPTLQIADSVILAPRADATIVVVRAGHTVKESLERAVVRLRRARVSPVGAVLNAVPERRVGYYGYYRYKRRDGRQASSNFALIFAGRRRKRSRSA